MRPDPRLLRALALAAAFGALGALAAPARAQQFMGTVVLPDGATPVAGVIVVANDAAGRPVTQTVTGAEGRFVLFVDSLKPVTLRLLRTGFAPTAGPTQRLGHDEVADVVVTLGAEAVKVPALRRGASTCGRANAADRAAAQLVVEEARKTFVAAQATVGRTDIVARYVTFDHRVAKTGEDTLRSLLRRATGALPSLFHATTAEELEASGFFATVGGERVFRAPEPALLGTEWFISTHCFSLAPQEGGLLRVEFRPARERKGLVDLEGAYLFDATTLTLRRAEFRFQGMREEERFANAGGVLDFAQLDNGDWVTVRWYQRFPLLGYRTGDGNTTLVRSTMTLIDIIGHRVQGGRVLAVLKDDLPLLRADPVEGAAARSEFGRACPERVTTQLTGAARGTVAPVDSESVSGVLVRATWDEPVVVDRTEFTKREHLREAFTDAQGQWLICDIPMRRDVTVRWETRGRERTVPFTLTAPGIIQSVATPSVP